jgi:hypothetical protein
MLNFSINRRRQDRPQGRPAAGGQRGLDLGLDRRPRVQKTFEFIFKETIGGVETMHSRSDRARWLDRYGAWYSTSPGLRDWLNRWRAGGGVAIL